MAALYRGTEGSPLGRAMGESFRATLEYLLECIPQLLICVLPERVQILPYGVREEDRFLWIDGYRRRRPWPVKIMTRGKTSERVKTSFFFFFSLFFSRGSREVAFDGGRRSQKGLAALGSSIQRLRPTTLP